MGEHGDILFWCKRGLIALRLSRNQEKVMWGAVFEWIEILWVFQFEGIPIKKKEWKASQFTQPQLNYLSPITEALILLSLLDYTKQCLSHGGKHQVSSWKPVHKCLWGEREKRECSDDRYVFRHISEEMNVKVEYGYVEFLAEVSIRRSSFQAKIPWWWWYFLCEALWSVERRLRVVV